MGCYSQGHVDLCTLWQEQMTLSILQDIAYQQVRK